jgi:hypothetical protein
MYDFISDAIKEWNGDDVDELFELLETHLSDLGVELKYKTAELEDDEEEEAPEEEDDDDDFNGDDEDDDSLSEDEPLDLPDGDND